GCRQEARAEPGGREDSFANRGHELTLPLGLLGFLRGLIAERDLDALHAGIVDHHLWWPRLALAGSKPRRFFGREILFPAHSPMASSAEVGGGPPTTRAKEASGRPPPMRRRESSNSWVAECHVPGSVETAVSKPRLFACAMSKRLKLPYG